MIEPTLPPCPYRAPATGDRFACASSRVRSATVTAATCARCPWANAPPPPARTFRGARFVGLGDIIAAVAALLGFRRCAPCDRRRRALNRITWRAWVLLWLVAQAARWWTRRLVRAISRRASARLVTVAAALLANQCRAADPPVFDYTRHYATLIVFEEYTCLSAYGLDADDRLVMRFAAFTGSDEPWRGRTLRIEYHGCYDVQGVSYPWRARAWLTADTLILWDRLGSDPLPGTIWAWPHLGVEHPSPAEVLAATPAEKPDPNVGLEPNGPAMP